MPELPEVESVRQDLIDHIVGKTISAIRIFSLKQLVGNPKKAIGHKIIDIQRSGKYIAIQLDNHYFLNVHLKLTGQFLFAKNINEARFKNIIPFTKTKQMPGPTTRIIFKFADGSLLFYNDLRKFGWIKITKNPEFPSSPDVLSKQFTKAYFVRMISKSTRPIKILLIDQHKLAGIGNIYANEVLFATKIHPLQPADSLTHQQTSELFYAVKKIVRAAIKHHGTSASDEAFILPDSNKGSYQEYLMVYDRENQPCKRCGSTIKRIKHHGRSSFVCPNCQNLIHT